MPCFCLKVSQQVWTRWIDVSSFTSGIRCASMWSTNKLDWNFTFIICAKCILGKYAHRPSSSSWPIPALPTMSSALLHFFCVACGWQWITVTQGGTPSIAIGRKCSPWLWRNVEAHHVTLDDVFIAQFGSCQFFEGCYRTRRRGYPWTGDHLPYDGRGLASADVAASWLWRGHMNRWDAGWWSWGHDPSTRHQEWNEGIWIEKKGIWIEIYRLGGGMCTAAV